MLNTRGRGPVLLPEEKFKDYMGPKLKDRNHYQHFADASLGGEKTESYLAQTGPMTESILLGNSLPPINGSGFSRRRTRTDRARTADRRRSPTRAC